MIDPVSPCPRTLQTASLDESQRTETLVRTSFWPEQFRSRQELSIDVVSVMDELFNEKVSAICENLQFRVAYGSIYSSSYKIELREGQQGHLRTCGFIAVDMESSRFRRLAKAKGFEVSMVRARALF